MGKKRSSKKPPKQVKTKEVRQQETNHKRSQITRLGFGSGNPDVAKFLEELDRFTETGVAWTGDIKLHGHQRVIKAILTTRPSVTSSVSLVYQADV